MRGASGPRLAPALLLAWGVLLPLAGLWRGGGLVGWSGVSWGEFESWAFFDWWLPKLAALRWHEAGLAAALRVPAVMDVGNVLDQWLITLPCKALFGPVAGHDVRVAVVLALNALAALFLVRQAARALATEAAGPASGADPAGAGADPAGAGADPAGAGGLLPVALALALALNPITLWDIAECRFAQALLAPTFLYLGLLLRWPGRTRPVGQVAALGASLALVGLTYWYAAVFLLPLALWAGARAPRSLAHLLVAAALVLPFAWPYAALNAGHFPYGAPFPPLSTLTVPPRGALGPLGPGLTVSQSVDLADPLRPVASPTVPWVWLILAGFSLLIGRGSRALRPLLWCSLLWWSLALGPYLVWHGVARPVALPFAAACRFVPFWARLYWPGRTLPYAFLAWVLGAAPVLGMMAQGKIERWVVAAAVAAGAILPGVAAGLLPLPCTAPQLPAFYRGLRGGVIEASFAWGSNRAGYYQSCHRQKVLGNQAQHAPAFGDDAAVTNGLLTANRVALSLAAVRDGHADPAPGPWPASDLAALQVRDYRWIMVQLRYGGHPLPTAAALAARVSEGLGRAPDHQDADLLAWRI